VVLPPGSTVVVPFAVSGVVAAGTHRVSASAVVTRDGVTDTRYASGFDRLDYAHIRPLHLVREATLALTSVDVTLPTATSIGYIAGVGDNVRPMLEDLGFTVTPLEPATLATADLRRFRAVVVGPRAYEASDHVTESAPRLLEYARNGGTLVVQYGQYEMTQPGVMPYPVTIARPHDRVTEEDAEVSVLAPTHPLLNTPNKIGADEWRGWVQERSLYMPRTFDARYTPLLSMHDRDEPARNSALLVAPLGRGVYVYSTLAFFRQLPVAHPGAAKMFVNLLSANAASTARWVP
jgi:hypothetical protein